MTLTPKNGYLFVEALPVGQDKTVSGIIIPKNTSATDEQLAQGTVRFTSSEEYPIGTEILFNNLTPDNIHFEIDGKDTELFSIHVDNITATIQR